MPFSDFKSEYVDLTHLTIIKRLKAHYYNGSIKNHYKEYHYYISSLDNIMNNTEVI